MTKTDLAAFGAEVRARREALGMRRQSLAEAAGLTALALQFIECGITRRPHRTTIRVLLEVLAENETSAAAPSDARAPGRGGRRGVHTPSYSPTG